MEGLLMEDFLLTKWMESILVLALGAGLVFALIVPSAALSYLLVAISGFFAGRLLYERKHKLIFPFIIMIAVFLAGYLVGMRYGYRIVAFMLFAAGMLLSY